MVFGKMDPQTQHDLTIVLIGGAILALLYAQWPAIGGPALALIAAVIVLGLLARQKGGGTVTL